MIWQQESRIIGSVVNQSLVNPGDALEHIMGTVTLPPGTLAEGRAIRVICLCEATAGTHTAKMRARLGGIGGTNIFELTSPSNDGSIGAEGIVCGLSSSSQALAPNQAGKEIHALATTNLVATTAYDSTTSIDIVFILAIAVDTSGTVNLTYGIVEQI